MGVMGFEMPSAIENNDKKKSVKRRLKDPVS